MATVTLASGLTLSYGDHGVGPAEPVVLLLPGPTDAWRSYQPVLELLPPGLRAVAVSQRGHGTSDKPESGYDVGDFAADVIPLLDALGIARAVIAGHSGSCLAARRVALDHPDRVAGLVLEAAPTTLRDDPRLRELVASLSSLEDPVEPGFAQSFVTATSSDHVEPGLVEALVADVLAVPARVWRATFAGLLRYDDTADLPFLEAPTLLVWGDADGLVTREMQDELVRAIPAAELLVYPGVGHTPRWEDPARFSRDLAAFARRVWRTR